MKEFLIQLGEDVIIIICFWCVIHDIGYYFAKGFYRAQTKYMKQTWTVGDSILKAIEGRK